jgi:hypothetical protein
MSLPPSSTARQHNLIAELVERASTRMWDGAAAVHTLRIEPADLATLKALEIKLARDADQERSYRQRGGRG